MAKAKQVGYRFPGMDPWLEHPDIWPSIHHLFITYLTEDLAAKVSPRYSARPGEREVLEIIDRSIYPDVVISRRARRHVRESSVAVLETTATEPTEAPVIVRLGDAEAREPFIEIRDRRDGGKVVTVIEVLSPSNKRSGTDSREQYLEKQRELLATDVSLVEIDLLRAGLHTVSLPERSLGAVGPFDYLVVVRRASKRADVEVYPIPLRKRLPRIRVPLARDDADVVADLQPHVERAYRVCGYSDDIDYRKPPATPLGSKDRGWARRVASSASS